MSAMILVFFLLIGLVLGFQAIFSFLFFLWYRLGYTSQSKFFNILGSQNLQVAIGRIWVNQLSLVL